MSALRSAATGRMLRLDDVSEFRAGDIIAASSGTIHRVGWLTITAVYPDVNEVLVEEPAANAGIPVLCTGDTLRVDWFAMAHKEFADAQAKLYRARARELEEERGRKP